jgi:hypothetical protein
VGSQPHPADTTGWFSSRRLKLAHTGYKTFTEEGTGRLLGAHLLGSHAEEIINIFALAIRHQLPVSDLSPMIYAYPASASDISSMLWPAVAPATGTTRRIGYLLPGVVVLAIGSGASQTGVAVAEDLATGMIDRFRSLPIASAPVLAGRVTADAVRNLFVAGLIIAVGSAIGFRFHAGPAAALDAVTPAAAGGIAFSWLNLLPGSSCGTPRRRPGRAVPSHHPHLHQLHPGPRRHLARMAPDLRHDQPDHGHGRHTASPVPRLAHRQAGQRGTSIDRRPSPHHRPAAICRYRHATSAWNRRERKKLPRLPR